MTDSVRLNEAIRKAQAEGKKSYTIAAKNPNSEDGKYYLDSPIVLPSNFTLYLFNCTLTMVADCYANMIVSEGVFDEYASVATQKKDIRIIGIGQAILDQGPKNDLTEKTSEKEGRPHIMHNCPILFRNVYDFVIEHITIKNQRYWGINLYYCSNGRISDIRFFATNNMPNQDGIDLRVGCFNIDIFDISGWTGDDSVALTALPLGRGEALMRVEGKSVDIHHVDIARVATFISGGHQTIRLLNHDGAKIHDIKINDITDATLPDKKPARATVVIGDTHYFKERPAKKGETYNISVWGVDSHALVGLEVRHNNVENLTYKHVTNPDYTVVRFAEEVTE